MTLEISPAAMGQLVSAISTNAPKSNGSTHRATVLRTDNDGTTWVSIPGGADETPLHGTLVECAPGDVVDVTIANGRATATANATSPAATGRTVGVVRETAETAQLTANDAAEAAASAIEDATLARAAATSAQASAQDAETAAGAASIAADNAQVAANAATFALSDVEKVVGTLEWIAEHGEYQLTTDTAVVAGKVYYTRSGTDPDYVYTVVAEPRTADIATYYELHMDESVQNFIASHLWLDAYGLNLSVDSSNGYRIHQGTVDGTKTMGMYVLDATGAAVASFGADGFQVGTTGKSHLVGDYHSLQLVDKNASTYFHVSDLRDKSGTVTFSDVIIADGRHDYWTLTHRATALVSVFIDDVDRTDIGSIEQVGSDSRISLNEHYPQDGARVVVTYTSTSSTAKAYTIGKRKQNESIGAYSVAEGENCIAAGRDSHAEGKETSARGNYSHVEGQNCSAKATGSHAEGFVSSTGQLANYAHAEGSHAQATGSASHAEGANTVASGANSHAEGSGARASAEFSHAQNYGTRAASTSQTALGRYNVEDANDQYAAIIGNGTSDSARSNALTVGWDGSVDAADAITSHGLVFTKTDAIDIDGSNPSAVQYTKWFQCSDKDDDRVAIFGGARETDGRTRGFFYAYNKKADGTLVNNHMFFYVDKNGNCTYGLSDPAAFCATLHVGDRVVKDQSTAVSLSTATWSNVCNISLAAGTWVIEATVQFASNATGRRHACISETGGTSVSGSDQRQTGASIAAVSGGSTYLHIGCTKMLTATKTVYLCGWQNSGAALNTYGCITAVRVR